MTTTENRPADTSSTPESYRRTGGRAVAQALIDNGVTDLFGVHGYINSVIEEACRLGARMWHFRHEQAAGFAAEAYGRAARKPGVCFASASAGMANYLSSLSQAIGTRSPMVLLVGQHGTALDRLEGLQEGYAAEAFTSVAKWTKRCTDWELNSYWVRQALVDAVGYPAGPVVLEFPLNNQWAFGDQPQRKYVAGGGLPAAPATQGDPERIAAVADLLLAAERPLLVAGDGIYWSGASAEFQELATLLQAPAGARRTARGAIPEDHPMAYAAGYRGRLLAEADVIGLVGLRAGELESWFEAPDWPQDRTYIQAHEVPGEIWHGLPTAATVVGSSRLVLRQIIEALTARLGRTTPVDRPAWIARLADARARHQERRARLLEEYAGRTPIHTYELAQALADVLDPGATVIYDSYQGSLYLTDALTARFPGQVLDAGPRVALGQGIGMCFGAAIARPGTQIVSLIGDGGIGLAGMDIETFTRYGIPAVFVILNNSSWGGNSLSQADLQPNISSWAMTPGVRYDQMFAPLGCHTEHVEGSDDLRPALNRALRSGRPAVVNVVADTDSPATSLPWLRLKTGEYYSRGIADLPESVLKHFHVSPVEALRLHKTSADNGTLIPLSFIADLTGTAEPELRATAERLGYHPHGLNPPAPDVTDHGPNANPDSK